MLSSIFQHLLHTWLPLSSYFIIVTTIINYHQSLSTYYGYFILHFTTEFAHNKMVKKKKKKTTTKKKPAIMGKLLQQQPCSTFWTILIWFVMLLEITVGPNIFLCRFNGFDTTLVWVHPCCFGGYFVALLQYICVNDGYGYGRKGKCLHLQVLLDSLRI